MKTESEPKSLSILSAIQLMRQDDEDKIFEDKYVIDKVFDNYYILEKPSGCYRIFAKSRKEAEDKIIKRPEIIKEALENTSLNDDISIVDNIRENYEEEFFSKFIEDDHIINIDSITNKLSKEEQYDILDFILTLLLQFDSIIYLRKLSEYDEI